MAQNLLPPPPPRSEASKMAMVAFAPSPFRSAASDATSGSQPIPPSPGCCGLNGLLSPGTPGLVRFGAPSVSAFGAPGTSSGLEWPSGHFPQAASLLPTQDCTGLGGLTAGSVGGSKGVLVMCACCKVQTPVGLCCPKGSQWWCLRDNNSYQQLVYR